MTAATLAKRKRLKAAERRLHLAQARYTFWSVQVDAISKKPHRDPRTYERAIYEQFTALEALKKAFCA